MKHLLFFVFTIVLPSKETFAQLNHAEWYELKIYTLSKPEQEKVTEQFLKGAYLPALHRQGLQSIGVLKPVETDSTYGKKIYVLIAYSSFRKFTETQAQLNSDQQFQEQGKEYLLAAHDHAPYTRMESILMKAFEKAPRLQKPNLNATREERIYELRSYEGPTEKKNMNKIKMFNDGDEIGLFASLKFNAVFYGEVMAGSHMPNLMYMTTFESMAARDDHWKAFFASAQWEKLKGDKQYQNNVSHADIMLLRPTEYSDY